MNQKSPAQETHRDIGKKTADSNPFAPMPAASKNPGKSRSHKNPAPVLLGLLALFTVASIVFLVLTEESSLIMAMVDVAPGVLLILVTILLPSGSNLAWRKKYWIGFKLVMILIGAMFIVPVAITSSSFQFVIFLATAPLGLIYLVDRLRRRYKPK